MYGSEIARILSQLDTVTPNFFRGVYSCDQLPLLHRPTAGDYCLIVNTEESSGPGLHWQAIYVEPTRSTAYFFCSLTQRPNRHVRQFLSNFSTVYTNRTAPQHAKESTCGGYCCFVLAMLCRGHTFANVCRFFDEIGNDDRFIRYFIRAAYWFELSSA